jgi:TP901 family phage tail tape measure protein
MSDRGGASLGTAEGRITVDVSQAIGSLNQLGGALTSFDAKATGVGTTTNQFTQSTVGLAQGMQQIGRVTTGLGVAMAAPFIGAAKAALDFESSMAGVNAVMDLQGSQFQDLSDLAQQLGKDTIFTGTQAAEGIETLGKAGISFEDILGGAAEAATNLAAAGGVDVPRAAEVMAGAMQAFNISGEDSVRVADALAGAANQSLSDINQLGIGLGQVAGVANAAGLSLEETTAFLALMADNGIRGSDAATSMKTAILALLSPTDKATGLMNEMGVSLLDTEGNFVGLIGASERFFDAWKGSGQTMEQFLDPLTDILGRDAVRTILFGMQAIEDQQKGLTTGMDDYVRAVSEEGAAMEFAEKRMDSTAGAIERLRGSLGVLAENFGKPIIEGIRGPIEALVEFTNALSNIPAPIAAAISIMGILTGGLTALGGAFLLVGGYVLEAVARFGAAGVTLGRVLSILTPIGAAIIAIGLAFVAVQNNFLGIADALTSLGGKIDATREKFEQFFNLFKQSSDFLSNAAQSISAFGHALDVLFGTDLSGFFDGIAGLVDPLAEVVENLDKFAFFFSIFKRQALFFSDIAKSISALGHTIDVLSGGLLNVSEFFDKVAAAVDAFILSWNNLQALGFSGVTSAIAALGLALHEAFGDNIVTDGLLRIAELVESLVQTFNTSIGQGLNPFAAALLAIGGVAQQLGLQGLANLLNDLAFDAQRFGETFEQAFTVGQAQRLSGLAAAVDALGVAIQVVTGIPIADQMSRLADAIDIATASTRNAVAAGINPFVAGLLGIRDALAFLTGADLAGFFDNLGLSISKVGDAVGQALGAGLGRLGEIFGQVGQQIAAGDFSGAMQTVIAAFEEFKGFLAEQGQRALEWVVNVGAPQLTGWIKEQAGRFGEWLQEQLGGVGDFAGQTLANVQNWFVEVGVPQITGWVQAAAEWIKEQIDKVLPKAGEVLGTVSGWVLEVGVPTIQEAGGAAAGAAGGIKDALIQWVNDQVTLPDVSELPDLQARATAFGENIGRTLTSAVGAAIQAIFQGGGGEGGGGFAVRDLPGLFGAEDEASFQQTGLTIIEGVLRGIGAGIAEGMGQENVATFIKTGDFEPLKNQIITALGDALLDLGPRIDALAKQTADEIENGLEAITSSIDSFMSQQEPMSGIGGAQGGMARGDALAMRFSQMFENLANNIGQGVAELPGKIAAAMGATNPFDAAAETIQGWADEFAAKVEAANKTVQDALNKFKGEEQAPPPGAGGGGRFLQDFDTLGENDGEQAAQAQSDGWIRGYTNIWGNNVAENKSTLDEIAAGAIDQVISFPPPHPPETGAEWVEAGGLAGLENGRGYVEGYGGGVQEGADQAAAKGPTLDLLSPVGTFIENALGPSGDAAAAEAVQQGFGPLFLGIPPAVDTEMGKVGQAASDAISTSSADINVGDALDSVMSTSVGSITLDQFSQTVGQKIGEAITQGIQGGDAQLAGSGDVAAGGIGSSVASALAESVGTADFTAVGTAIGSKIQEAITTGLSQEGAAGTAGATETLSIGTSIAASLANSLLNANFASVGTAIQTKIGEALTTGLSAEGQAAAGAAGGAATGIGTTIANSLALSISTADFAAVGAAISAKISEALTAGLAAPAAGGGPGVAAGVQGGSDIGSSIATSIASQISGADFSAVGQAVSEQIGSSLGSGTGNIQAAMGAVIQAVVAAGQGAAGQAQAIGTAITTAVGQGVGAGTGTITAAIPAAVQAGIGAGTAAATGGGQAIGTALTGAAGTGIGAGTGTVTAAVSAMVQAAISAGQGAAAGAQAVGTTMTTAVGQGLGASTGAVTAAMQAVVQAGIDAGVAAGAGAARIGENIVAGIVAGINSGSGAVAAAVASIVAEGIAAGVAAAESGSPSRKSMREIGEPLSDGIAVGIRNNAKGIDSEMRKAVNSAFSSLSDIGSEAANLDELGGVFSQMRGGEEFASTIGDISSRLADATKGVNDNLSQMVDDLRSKFKEGAKAAKEGSDAISGAASSAGAGPRATAAPTAEKPQRPDIKPLKGIVGDLDEMEDDIARLRELEGMLSQIRGADEFAQIVGDAADNIDANREDATTAAQDMMKEMLKTFQQAKKDFRREAKGIGDAVAEGVSEGMSSAATTAASSTDSVTDSVTGSLNANLTRLPEMGEAISNALGTGIQDGAAEQAPAMESAGSQLGNSFTDGVSQGTQGAAGVGSGLVQETTSGIDQAATAAEPTVQQSGTDLITSFSEGLKSAAGNAEAMTSLITQFGQGIRDSVTTLVPQVTQQGQQLGSAFATGVDSINPTQSGKSLIDEVSTGINTGAPTATKSALDAGTDVGNAIESGIESGCAPTNDVATDLTDSCIPKGINSGLPEATGAASDAGKEVSDSLMSGLDVKKKDVERNFDQAGVGFAKAMGSGIKNSSGDAVSASNELANKAGNVDAKPEGTEVGKSFGAGIAAGIESYIPEIIEAAKKAVQKAEEAAKEEGKSKSPSLVFAAIGRDLMAGMEVGMRAMIPSLESSSRDAVRATADVFAGAGIGSVAQELDRNLGRYSRKLEATLFETGRNLDSTRLPRGTDRELEALRRAAPLTGVRGQAQEVHNHYTLEGIEVREGTPEAVAVKTLVDSYRRNTGQYVGQG